MFSYSSSYFPEPDIEPIPITVPSVAPSTIKLITMTSPQETTLQERTTSTFPSSTTPEESTGESTTTESTFSSEVPVAINTTVPENITTKSTNFTTMEPSTTSYSTEKVNPSSGTSPTSTPTSTATSTRKFTKTTTRITTTRKPPTTKVTTKSTSTIPVTPKMSSTSKPIIRTTTQTTTKAEDVVSPANTSQAHAATSSSFMILVVSLGVAFSISIILVVIKKVSDYRQARLDEDSDNRHLHHNRGGSEDYHCLEDSDSLIYNPTISSERSQIQIDSSNSTSIASSIDSTTSDLSFSKRRPSRPAPSPPPPLVSVHDSISTEDNKFQNLHQNANQSSAPRPVQTSSSGDLVSVDFGSSSARNGLPPVPPRNYIKSTRM